MSHYRAKQIGRVLLITGDVLRRIYACIVAIVLLCWYGVWAIVKELLGLVIGVLVCLGGRRFTSDQFYMYITNLQKKWK